MRDYYYYYFAVDEENIASDGLVYTTININRILSSVFEKVALVKFKVSIWENHNNKKLLNQFETINLKSGSHKLNVTAIPVASLITY